MSFRLEEKLDINTSNISLFKNWLLKNNAKKIYEDRQISSIYMDNNNLDLYRDSIEGTTPRKKIRLRTYGPFTNYNNIKNLELKISSPEGKYKKTSGVNSVNSILKFGLFDKDYGICKPKVIVSYLRSYYKIFDLRVTLDINIKYFKFKNNFVSSNFINDRSFIAEIKSNNIGSYDYISKKIPFKRIRFSKYCRSIEHVYKYQLPI